MYHRTPAKLEVVDAAPEKDFDSAIINVRLQDKNVLNVPCRENGRMIHFDILEDELIGSRNGDPNGIQLDVIVELPPSAAAVRPSCAVKAWNQWNIPDKYQIIIAK